jgi:hypothetical protein
MSPEIFLGCSWCPGPGIGQKRMVLQSESQAHNNVAPKGRECNLPFHFGVDCRYSLSAFYNIACRTGLNPIK